MRRIQLISCAILACLVSFVFPTELEARSERFNQPAVCGTYPDRVREVLRKSAELRQLLEARRQRRTLSLESQATQDIDNIAVIEDDGTIVSPTNLFDLSNRTLRLTPRSPGNYTLEVREGGGGMSTGTHLPLTDDDSLEISFQAGFQFPFFGVRYSSVFVNSDGNVTFTRGDAEHTARDLSRFNGSVPRIAAFFTDLDPEAGQGGVYYQQLSDRFLISWSRIREFEGVTESTFQLTLFPDGSFELSYGAVSSQSGIVGWAAGGNLQPVTITDLTIPPASGYSGAVAEKFTAMTELEFTALAKKFYQTHRDDFDQLVVFTNFPYNLEDAFAYEITLKNFIEGIGISQFDYSREFGSEGTLESFLAMNQLSAFPDDPDTVFLGTNSTVDIMGQESGHRWLAFVRYMKDGLPSSDILGRDQAHWSFFFNSEASVMEGNEIKDNGDGSYSTVAATSRYSQLDQYLMGLREASEVGPMFYVTNVSGTRRVPSSPPAMGVTFRGQRVNLTLDDIVAVEGPRNPPAATAPKVFRQAFLLLVRQGTSPSGADLDKISRIRSRWSEFFSQATDGRGAAQTTLAEVPLTPVLTSVSPLSGSTLGGTRVYLTGSNFQSGASVTIGSTPATKVEIINSTFIIATTAPGAVGPVTVTVKNPDSDSVSLENSFTYVSLSPANVSPTSLRIPFAVDDVFYRSNLGINNPNPSPAIVRILQLDSNGLVVNQLANVTIPANGYLQKNSILRDLEGTSRVAGRQGSLVLESGQPIQAFVSVVNNQTGDPSILEGIRQGASRLILQSAANTGPFRSNLIVSNLSSTPAVVALRALGRETGLAVGRPLLDLSIPANGSLSFDNILDSLGVGDNYGPVEISSGNGASLTAVSMVSGLKANTSGFFVAQNPSDAGSLEIVPFAIDTNEFRTNLGLNNFGTQTANISVSLLDAAGRVLTSTSRPIQVAPLGMVQINNILRFLKNGSSNSPVTQLQGYLSISSDQPVKAFASQIDNVSNDPSILISTSTGGSHLLLKSSANTNFRSTLALVNPSASSVTVRVVAREGSTPNNGTVAGSMSVTLPANGAWVTNNLLSEVGSTSTFGPVEITTEEGLPVMAVSGVYSLSGNTSGFFSAQLIP